MIAYIQLQETLSWRLLSFLKSYHWDGPSLLDHIIMGDETYIHYKTPKMEGESAPKKVKMSRSIGRVCATIFWYSHGISLIKYTQKNLQTKKSSVTSHTYENTLKKLQTAIRHLRPWLLDEDVLLFHDSTRPHTAIIITQLLAKFSCTIFDQPRHSSDLAPSDFFLFPQLKKSLGGTAFLSHEEVKKAVNSFLQEQLTDFCLVALEGLVKCYCKCLNGQDNYLEKWIISKMFCVSILVGIYAFLVEERDKWYFLFGWSSYLKK